jgi:hypothetical protein
MKALILYTCRKETPASKLLLIIDPLDHFRRGFLGSQMAHVRMLRLDNQQLHDRANTKYMRHSLTSQQPMIVTDKKKYEGKDLINAMKPQRGVGVWLHSFITQALYGGVWSAVRPSYLAYEQRTPIPVKQQVR